MQKVFKPFREHIDDNFRLFHTVAGFVLLRVIASKTELWTPGQLAELFKEEFEQVLPRL